MGLGEKLTKSINTLGRKSENSLNKLGQKTNQTFRKIDNTINHVDNVMLSTNQLTWLKM